jgi:hypothetical protein
MTLNLLLAAEPVEGDAVIFADPSAVVVEAVVAGLVPQLEVQRLMFPLPDETTRRHVPAPSLLRGRHADLWHALSAEERARALLLAGETAAYLAPVLKPAAGTLVAVPDPQEAPGAWRSVLGAFAELDEVPEEAGSEAERDRWLDRVNTAAARLTLVRDPDPADVTLEVAARLGLGPKQAKRAATATGSAWAHRSRSRRRNGRAHWLDEHLYRLSGPVERQLPRKQRRR